MLVSMGNRNSVCVCARVCCVLARRRLRSPDGVRHAHQASDGDPAEPDPVSETYRNTKNRENSGLSFTVSERRRRASHHANRLDALQVAWREDQGRGRCEGTPEGITGGSGGQSPPCQAEEAVRAAAVVVWVAVVVVVVVVAVAAVVWVAVVVG